VLLSQFSQIAFTISLYFPDIIRAESWYWNFKLRNERKEKIMLRIETKWTAFLVPAVLLSVAIAACGVTATPAPAAAMAPITAAADEEVTYGNNGESIAIDSVASSDALNQVTTDTLSAAEIEGLLYMREEEKLARDVYLTLYEKWGMRIFQNISGSEQTHMDAVKTLLDRYDLEDPAAGTVVGVFTNPTLQELYEQLIDEGSRSLADALRVGATIEEIDILDLEERIAQTDKSDIQLVYENLMRGSRNHLRAFVSTLERQVGEIYQPQYLSQTTYDAIVNTPG
jgi:hypothetical protein